jgi:hypothetical protein
MDIRKNATSKITCNEESAAKIMQIYHNNPNLKAARMLNISLSTLMCYVDEIVYELGDKHGYTKKGKGGGFARNTRLRNKS